MALSLFFLLYTAALIAAPFVATAVLLFALCQGFLWLARQSDWVVIPAAFAVAFIVLGPLVWLSNH